MVVRFVLPIVAIEKNVAFPPFCPLLSERRLLFLPREIFREPQKAGGEVRQTKKRLTVDSSPIS